MSDFITKVIAALPVKPEARIAYASLQSGGEYPLFTEAAKNDCPSARYVGGVSRWLCECGAPYVCQGVRRATLAAAGIEFTAREYMDKSRPDVTHDVYFGQFVTAQTLARVTNHIGIGRIMASTDRFMNDIPLIEWQRMACDLKAAECCGLANTFTYAPGTRPQFAEADSVCLLKAAAKIIKSVPFETTITDTEYFRNKAAVKRYYVEQGFNDADIEQMLINKEAIVGKPFVDVGQEAILNSEGRYSIVTYK